MKRYSIRECARNGESWMEVIPSVNGEWVKAEDVDTLVKELDRKESEIKELRARLYFERTRYRGVGG